MRSGRDRTAVKTRGERARSKRARSKRASSKRAANAARCGLCATRGGWWGCADRGEVEQEIGLLLARCDGHERTGEGPEGRAELRANGVRLGEACLHQDSDVSDLVRHLVHQDGQRRRYSGPEALRRSPSTRAIYVHVSA